jgi:hypothetical protein
MEDVIKNICKRCNCTIIPGFAVSMDSDWCDWCVYLYERRELEILERKEDIKRYESELNGPNRVRAAIMLDHYKKYPIGPFKLD